MNDTTLIATRESRLALWQAEHVRSLLEQRFGLRVGLLGMTTQGDQILDRALSKVGGKGLFVKELEVALQEGRAHLAVHSLKDVPMELPEGFVLAAMLEREDPRDAFVSNHHADLAPLDIGTILESVHKTGRLLIVDEWFGPCGVGAEIAAQVVDQGFDDLDAPVRRLNSQHSPVPYSPTLEAAMTPSTAAITQAIRDLAAE